MSYTDRLSAGTLLVKSLKQSSARLIIAFAVAFIFLESFVLFKAQLNSLEKFEQWINNKRPQLEQSLFLENHLSVRGLLKNSAAELPDGITANVSVFSLGGERILGDLNFPPATKQGLKHAMLTNSFSYFQQLKFGDIPQGYLYVHGKMAYGQLASHALITLLFVLIIYFVSNRLIRTFFSIVGNRILEPIHKLQKHMNSNSIDKELSAMEEVDANATSEVADLVNGYNVLVRHVHTQQTALRKFAEQKAAAAVARQVAHDIRSPLTALNMIADASKHLQENERILLRSAIKRINDIANHLKAREAIVKEYLVEAQSGLSVEMISGLLSTLCTEKRMQYRLQTGILIEEEYKRSSLSMFSLINANEFKSVVSNIIDNSRDAAINGSASIRVSINKIGSNCEIIIKDNGVGISDDVIHRLGERGFSHNKAEGSGLGLNHAFRTVKSWGGKVKISSTLNEGTSVAITLPLCQAPSWFIDSVKISSNTQIVIIDDDEAIHHTWDRLLSRHRRSKLLHFKNLDDCENFLSLTTNSDIALFVDYEIGESSVNGLSFLKSVHLDVQKYLVTSHWEEIDLREKVQEANLKLIPKNIVPFLSISYTSEDESLLA